ncbi:radical SAM protein [Mammaliicoccus sciuri]|uniref:radical SAM/SPASM domain-containing protein n=1 Tax=Mammaliicoccus sciuri TaxID=1296 RepID=UPI00378F671D
MNDLMNNNKILYHLQSIDHNEIVSFEIHPTNICNYLCDFCSYSYRKSNGKQIELDILLETINEISKRGCKSITLAGGGDPTMYKNLPLIVEYIKSKNMEVAVLSNGSNKKMIEKISSDCTYILLNIVSTNKETYKKMMGRDMKEILNFPKTISDKTTLGVRVVVTNENVENLVETTKELLNKGFSYVQITPAVDYEKSRIYVDNKKLNNVLSDKIFDSPNVFMNIKRDNRYTSVNCYNVKHSSHGILSADGNIYICPPLTSIHKKYSIGNINYEKFEDIWEGEKHLNLKEVMEKRYIKNECKNCRFIGYNEILDSYKSILNNEHKNLI